MATVFGHAVVAYTIKLPFNKFKQNKRMTFACIVSSIFPDIDVLAFSFGIPYGDIFGHRGFTHSLLFALVYALVVIFVFFRSEVLKYKIIGWVLLFLSTVSHGVLDAFTNGGMGVGFLIPFTSKRYFFSERFIEVSPIGRNFLSMRGLETLYNEAIVILFPALIVGGIYFLVKKINNKGR